MNKIIYILTRVRKDDTKFGKSHIALTDHKTLCGKEINETWWIDHMKEIDECSCKKCLNLYKSI